MNNSTLTAAPISADIYYQFIIFGSIASTGNAFILFTFFRNLSLLKKSSSVVGLAVGDLINGLALFVAGCIRTAYVTNNTFGQTVHPFYCVVNHATVLFLLGNQLPSVMLVVIAFERLAAVHFYKWYYKSYSNKMSWTMTTAAITVCILSVLLACVLVYVRPKVLRISNVCNTPEALGSTSAYNVYNYSTSILYGTVAVALTLTAMVILIKRKKRLQQNEQYRNVNKKEWQMTKAMTMVSAFDFMLVVVPNILVLFKAIFNVTLITNLPYYSLQIICCRSALNIVIYIVFNRDFRKQFRRAIGFTYIQATMTNVVFPYSNNVL